MSKSRSAFLSDFGYRVKERRVQSNLSQSDIAEAIGISQPAYCKLENGAVDISIRRAAQIAFVLNTTLPELLKGIL